MSRSREANPCMQIVAHYGNARQIQDRFSLARLIGGYRIRADERSWRRAAYGSRSNWPGEWVVAAVLSVAIVLTGIVQTRQHWGTMPSEPDAAKQSTAPEKVQDKNLPQRLVSLNAALEEANAERKGLQVKLDQAQSQLRDKQSELEAVESDLEAAKQAAALINTQTAEFPKKFASLNSELEQANAQRKEFQTKLDQAQSQLRDKQSELEGVQSELEAAKQAAALMTTQALEFPKKLASLNAELEEANAQRKGLQAKFDQGQSQLKDKQSEMEAVQSELEAAKQAAALMNAQAAEFPKRLEEANAQRKGLQANWTRPNRSSRPSSPSWKV
jgi:chromosome segregation ATPase